MGSEYPVERLRRVVFEGIRIALELDPVCKAYEGAVSVAYPSYFAGQSSGVLYQPVHEYHVSLSCYVFGPGRHYEWKGASLEEVCHKALTDVRMWIAEVVCEEWITGSGRYELIDGQEESRAYKRLLARAMRLVARAMEQRGE